ncbi:MAG: PHP domain-containing protein [Candidatus Eisenbacteria bacterium]|nr:PHP domain-containing protein [Candidatus Eisenbacteria bacterium]
MPQIYADMHVHSLYSDGRVSPEDLLLSAAYAGLSVLALTDHDTVDGIEPMRVALSGDAPRIVPGVELSCTEGDREIHLLGYWIDPEHRPLRRELRRIRDARIDRAQNIVDRLREHQIALEFDDVMALTRNGLVGRLHIAEVMRRSGHVPDLQAAFRDYLGDGRPAVVPKRFLTPEEGIRIIRDAGGVAVLAHPGIGGVAGMAGRLKEQGLHGLEVWHPKHTHRENERFAELCTTLGLVPTGGSDYHGSHTGTGTLGYFGLTLEGYERLAGSASIS